MKAYKPITPSNITFEINESTEGETIETRVERIMNNAEPMTDGAPEIYTERKHGVIPEFDIRTDRFDLALEGSNKIAQDKLRKRQERWEKNNTKEPEKTTTTPNTTTTPPATPDRAGEPAK